MRGGSLDLFIGRKRRVVEQPWRLEWTPEVKTINFSADDEMPDVSFIGSETLRLFIADKPFSTSTVSPHRRWARRSIAVRKRVDDGRFEIHLTKKYTIFH